MPNEDAEAHTTHMFVQNAFPIGMVQAAIPHFGMWLLDLVERTEGVKAAGGISVEIMEFDDDIPPLPEGWVMVNITVPVDEVFDVEV